ncbi:MAG: GGDEF domain-containing protein [Magnetococcus sp. YQC-5]
MAASEEIQSVLKRLLVLLSTQPPHLATARKQLEDLLAQNPCADMSDAPRKAVVRLLDQLAAPALVRDPEMRVVLEGLRERLVRTGSLAGSRSQLDKASAWLGRPRPHDEANEVMPFALSTRLRMGLALGGHEMDSDQEHQPDPWHSIEKMLHDRMALGESFHASVWSSEELEFCEFANPLLQDLNAQSEIPLVVHSGSGGAEGCLQTLRSLTQLLRQRGKEWRQRARSLDGRISDSKEMAERLRGRLRQLEEALSRARVEGFMDPVTGLPDRFAFTAQLKRHLERSVHLQESFALALIHVYDFLPIIQRLGRVGESRLVEGLVREIRVYLRDEEYLARLSDERFVILLPKSDQKRADLVVREIDHMLHQTQFSLDDKMILLEVYCGTVALGADMTGLEILALTDRVSAVAREEARDREPLVVPLRTCVC